MRIAVVHSFYSESQPSGENNVVRAQASQLRRSGHEVLEVSRHTDALDTTRGYRRKASMRVATGVGWSPDARLEDFHPQVIHLHNTFPNIGTNWLRRWGEITVATVHNFRNVCAAATLFRDEGECTDCLKLPILPAIRHACYGGSKLQTVPVAIGTSPKVGGLRKLTRLVNEIIVLNQRSRDAIAGTTSAPINVVPNFASVDGVERQSTGDGWVYAGRISPEKGLRELLSVFPPQEQLHIYGDGPDRLRLQREFPLAGNVHWHGAVNQADFLRMLPKFAGLLMPSQWPEGVPTVVLEALASGVPVAISPRVAIAEDLISGGGGTALPLFEGRESLQRALDLLKSPQMRAAAANLYEATYTPAAWSRAMEPIYGRLRRAP